MNLYLSLVLLLLVSSASSTFVNTTDFWKKKLNLATDMSYECYSGMQLLMQVMKKSTGTTLKDSPECITAYLPHIHTVLLYLTNEFHSLSGSKEGQEQAHSSEPSPSWVLFVSPRIAPTNCHRHGTSWDILFSLINH